MFERLIFHTLVTLQEMGLGLTFAIALALPLSLGMHISQTARRLLEPLCLAIQGFPMFAMAPLMVFLFGWSQVAILVPMVLMLIFPLSINFLKGIEATPQEFLRYYALHGLSSWRLIRDVRLPFAYPHVFAGLRIAASVSVTGAIAGEWAGGQAGLGVYMQMCRRDFEIYGLLGSFAAILLLSLIAYFGTKWVEERCAI